MQKRTFVALKYTSYSYLFSYLLQKFDLLSKMFQLSILIKTTNSNGFVNSLITLEILHK